MSAAQKQTGVLPCAGQLAGHDLLDVPGFFSFRRLLTLLPAGHHSQNPDQRAPDQNDGDFPTFHCPLWPECACQGGIARPECPGLKSRKGIPAPTGNQPITRLTGVISGRRKWNAATSNSIGDSPMRMRRSKTLAKYWDIPDPMAAGVPLWSMRPLANDARTTARKPHEDNQSGSPIPGLKSRRGVS